MMLIAFRSKLTGAAGDDYGAMSAAMEKHARSFPGFVDVKAFTAADGERLTLVWWQDEQTLEAWANDVKHGAAKAVGRAKWYDYYKIDVARIVRSSNFTRDAAGDLAAATSSPSTS